MVIHRLKSGREIMLDEVDLHLIDKYIFNTMLSVSKYTRYVALKDLTTRKYAGLLHRIIMNASNEEIVDHKNGNGLDCTRDNLRICSNLSQNQYNRRLTKVENEVKGLQFRKDRGYWVASIRAENKRITLGTYVRKEDAIAARLEAEKIYHKDFAGYGTDQ